MKKIVLLLLLFPLLMISFVAGFGVLIAASPSIIRVPDDYEKIQWAIGNASDGDTIFVRTGTYYKHVTVSKPLVLVGEYKVELQVYCGSTFVSFLKKETSQT